MARRRHTPPFDLRVDRLGPKGLGMGTHDGRLVAVRGAPPGAVVTVAPFARKDGVTHGRRLALVEPPLDGVAPRCAVFGLCGGCTLQELPLASQRHHKLELALAEAGPVDGVRVHPVRGTDEAYGYRNKVELSYGVRRYQAEADHQAGLPMDGRWLGFHAPGRFDRVVPAARCELVPEGLNAVIRAATAHLRGSTLEPWDVRTHTGFWRHLVLREATTGERLVAVFTAPPADGAAAEAELASLAASLPDVTGVVWHVAERTADAALGPERAVLRGRRWIEERCLGLRFRLSVGSFFQTNTLGAEVLYQTVAEAAGTGGRLLDLYCGTGTIGQVLAAGFETVLGVEREPSAVADARENAAQAGLSSFGVLEGAVEDVVDAMGGAGPGDVVVVDPPRAGLHPRACRWLASQRPDRLVYVACQPASLGRDRRVLEADGWRLTDLWAVDLFPQTHHMELVARFVQGDTA